jgi:hypothetical protein
MQIANMSITMFHCPDLLLTKIAEPEQTKILKDLYPVWWPKCLAYFAQQKPYPS